MSLYDEALLAGSVAPGQDIPPELLQQILAMRDDPRFFAQGSGQSDYWYDPGKTYDAATDTHGYMIENQRGYRTVGTGEGSGQIADSSLDRQAILRLRAGSGAKLGDTWDPKTGKYLGTYQAQDAGGRQMNQAIALMAAGYFGGSYLNGLGEAAAGAGNAGLDAAMIDMGAGATNVGGAAVGETTLGMSAAEQAAFLEANAGALAPGGEVATGYGTTWGVGADGIIGSGATMSADGVALDQIANNYGTQNIVDGSSIEPVTPPADPTGPGTMPPGTTPPGTTTTTPVTTPTSTTPNIPVDPSKISDWTSLFNVLSGLYGLKLAGDAAEKSDPFGPYRKGYADRLQALEANPGLLKSTPGYLGGLDAIQRQMAAKGYLGSGNMAGALMRYSGDSYHNEANRLATLAGASIGPGQTYFNQAQLTGQALSNIGYGLTPYMQGGPR